MSQVALASSTNRELLVLEAGSSPDDVLDALNEDGAVIIEQLASNGLMDQISIELESYLSVAKNSVGPFWGYKTKRLGALVRRSPSCQQLLLNSTVLEVAERALGPFCDRIQVNQTQAIRLEPGESQQVPHSDDVVYPIKQTGLRCLVNAMWAHCDFTVENGATLVAPGSHDWESYHLPEQHELVPAEMPRGSVLLYFGGARHCGGANRSREPRTGLVMSYVLGWLRQTENQYLAFPPELARDLPERLQRLLGYSVHTPNLGTFEGQDSIYALQEQSDEPPAYRDYLPEGFGEMLEQYRRNQERDN